MNNPAIDSDRLSADPSTGLAEQQTRQAAQIRWRQTPGHTLKPNQPLLQLVGSGLLFHLNSPWHEAIDRDGSISQLMGQGIGQSDQRSLAGRVCG